MLAVNALIEWMENKVQGESVIERILWLDEMSDLTYVIDVNANKLPYARTKRIQSSLRCRCSSGA